MIFASNEHEKRESKKKYGGSKKERNAQDRLKIMPEIDLPEVNLYPELNSDQENLTD